MKKKFTVLLMIVLTVGLLAGCNEAETDGQIKKAAIPDESQDIMEIHFIDVGQGDCTFIDYGEYEALVDCGEWNYSDKVIQYITPYIDGALDLVIATHPDSDHIGGMQYILDSFQVISVIDSGAVKDTITYDNYIKAVNRQYECYYSEDEDCVIPLDAEGKAKIKIIETGDENSDINELSVIAQLNYQDVSVLLTGDMGQKTEKANLDKFSQVDVLKAAHHGSSKSSSEELLRKIKPDYVIISVGEDNSYGHPHKETMQRFADIGATVYQTMNSGTIVMKTDGKVYNFEAQGSLTVNEPKDNTTYSTGSSGNVDESVTDVSYVGNKKTKKFHYSNCSSATRMSEDNKVYFDSKNEAVDKGYEPCGICNP